MDETFVILLPRKTENHHTDKLTDSAVMYRQLGSSRFSSRGDGMYRDRGNDDLVSSAIRFRSTLGNPKEATGNGRTVDRVICESLPEGYIRTWLLIKASLFLNGNTTSDAARQAPRWNVESDREKESSLIRDKWENLWSSMRSFFR